jgi:hypothetical protein
MLCQHLGFDKTDASDINTGLFGSRSLIATGDLICNNTQASGISCCTHLVPSTTTTNVRISKVICEYGLRVTRIKSAKIKRIEIQLTLK